MAVWLMCCSVLLRLLRKFLNIQALMCVALMSTLYHLETLVRSLTQLVTSDLET